MNEPIQHPHPTRRFWTIAALSFLSFVVLVAVVAAVFRTVVTTDKTASTTQDVRQTQLEGTPFGKSLAQSVDNIAQVLALLQDCINPEGTCAKAAAENQKQVLKVVHDDTILAIACADKPGVQTVAEINTCVRETQRAPTP